MKFDIKGKQKIILYAAIGAIGIFFIGRFLFLGLARFLTQLDKQTRVEEARLKNVLAIQKAKDIISADYDRYKPYLRQENVPEQQATEELLKEIERIAKDAGASVLNLSPQPAAEQTKEYKKYKADLRMELNMAQLFNFLHSMQQSKLLIKADKLSIIPKDEQATLLKIDMTISMAVL